MDCRACQAPLSMKFSQQEYWSGLPCPSTGDMPNPGTKHRSSTLQGDFFFTIWATQEALIWCKQTNKKQKLHLELDSGMHMHVNSVLFNSVTPGTAACKDPLSMGLFRQEYCSGLPLSLPGALPDTGIKPALAGGFLSCQNTKMLEHLNK